MMSLDKLDDFSPRPLSETFTHVNPTVLSSYNICRDAEQKIMHRLSNANDDLCIELNQRLINVRILGHLLSYGPSDASIAYLAHSIVSTGDYAGESEGKKLAELGGFIETYFMRSCK
jgi:hypothetical protein